MNDTELNNLLLGAREDVELPASFQREVWRAITASTARDQTRWAWLTGLIEWLARPLPAAAAWSLALLCGLLVGVLKPPAPPATTHAEAYAQMINPLAKMHTP